MLKLIKDNFILVLGLALPIGLTLVFAIAANFPRLTSTPLETDFLLYSQDYSHNNHREVRVYVQNGKIISEYLKHDNTRVTRYRGVSRLFHYDAKRKSLREIAVAPKIDPNLPHKEWHSFTIPEIQKWQIDSSLISQDGYQIDNSYHSSGLMTEIFSGRRRRNQLTLLKDGVRVGGIETGNYYPTYNTKFLGWVTSKN